MADFPTFNAPDRDETDYTDLFDSGQVDNMIIGVMRSKDGFLQALDEVKETLGLVPEGTAEFKTQETLKEQKILREAAMDDQQLTGASAAEFLGESAPLAIIPFGAGVKSAAALGGLASSGFFQEDVNDSRLDDIALGAGMGGLFRMLIKGGRAKQDLEQTIDQAEQRLLGGPSGGQPAGLLPRPQQQGLPRPTQPVPQGSASIVPDEMQRLGGRQSNPQLGGPTTGQKLLAPPPRQAHSPNATLAQRGLTLDNIHGASDDIMRQTGINPAAMTAKTAAGQAKKALNEFKAKTSPKLADKAKRKVEVFAANAARKAEVLKKQIANGGPPRFITALQAKLTSALYEKIAANTLAKTIAHTRGLAAKVPEVAPEAPVAPVAKTSVKSDKTLSLPKPTAKKANKKKGKQAPTEDAVPTKVDEMTDFEREAMLDAGGFGGRQGGFAESDLVNTMGGAALGGIGGLAVSDGDPVAGVIGAVTGGFGVRAMGRRLDRVETTKQRAEMRAVSEAGGDYTEEVSRAMKARDVSKETIAKILQGGRGTLDAFLGSTMTRLENLAPRVAVALKEAEFQQHFQSGQWLSEGDRLFARITEAGLTDQQAQRYKIALLNSTKAGKAYLNSIGKTDAANAIGEFEGLLDNLGGYLKGVDLGDSLRRNYFPRMVKDLDAFPKAQQMEIDNYLGYLAKKKGVKLTDYEREIAITEVINGALTRGPDQTHFGRAASNLQKRTVKVDRSNVNAYADPHEAFNDYIESITTQVERRRFFKGQGVKVDDLGPNAENIETVASRLAKSLTKEDMTPDEVDEVAQLIRMRFGPGEQAPHKAIQNFKNLTYAGLLGNPVAAATQFGDIALSAHRNGIVNTSRAVIEDLFGRGKPMSGVDKETLLGIRNAAADFASRTSTRDMLNWSLKYSGFQRMDKLGKNTYIKAALMKAQKQTPEEFAQKWAPIFDPDLQPGQPAVRTKALYEKVQNFKGIDNTNKEDIGFMLWNELSGVQPIALSALPEKYLKHPDGRMGYMLQSFTLKLFDVMRKDIYDQVRLGNHKTAAKNAVSLSSLFVANNGSVDMFKNFMMNKEQDVPGIVANNYLKLIGLNKFMVGQVSREGLGSAVIKQISPPTSLIDAAADPREALKLLPLGGKLIESRME